MSFFTSLSAMEALYKETKEKERVYKEEFLRNFYSIMKEFFTQYPQIKAIVCVDLPNHISPDLLYVRNWVPTYPCLNINTPKEWDKFWFNFLDEFEKTTGEPIYSTDSDDIPKPLQEGIVKIQNLFYNNKHTLCEDFGNCSRIVVFTEEGCHKRLKT